MKEPDNLINIGRGQRNLRYISAAVVSVVALGMAVVLVLSGAPRLWRLLVYLPLIVASSSFYEAQDQVCTLLAGRGECSLDNRFYAGKTIRGEKIADATLVQQIRRKALRMTWKSQMVAIGLTVLFVILPV